MSVFLQPEAKKRVYWYRFMHGGQVIRRSTKQGHHKAAVDMEAAHKTALNKGDAGIFEREPAPTLAAFGKEFLEWAKATFREKPKTHAFYKNGVNRLSEYQPLASLALDDKRLPERLTGYVARRQTPTITEEKVRKALAIASINRELQVLRRLLNLAVEWGRIESVPKIQMLGAENHCEFVVWPTEKAKYLLSAPQLLSEVATMLVDSGLMPEEVYRLRWETYTWANGKHGTFLVTHGKTRQPEECFP